MKVSGKRQPTELVELKGAKHLTKAETAERRRSEVRAPVPKTAKPPKWLPEELKKDFRKIGKQLIELRLYSDLDADTLGRYLVAQHQYEQATEMVNKYLSKQDVEGAEEWGRIQERYAKQARNHAADLGLTISARCRLVIPEAPPKAEDNPFLKMIEAQREAQKRA
jgi:P27 family predicted phage terminase small subunit